MPVYLRKKRLRVDWSGKLTRATIVFLYIATYHKRLNPGN